MKCRALTLFVASLTICTAICALGLFGKLVRPMTAAAQAADNKADESQGPPPLRVDKSAPLLLEDPPPSETPDDPWEVPAGPMADNSFCHCCHTNYEKEPFAVWHQKANVGCVKCHGESYAHRDDEDNATPPEIMYWPERIQKNCEKCHDEHDVSAVEVISRWQQRCPAKTDPATVVCTDCHGQHRLRFRTVWWDKKTGELIVRQGDQRIKRAVDLTKTPGDESTDTVAPEDEMQ